MLYRIQLVHEPACVNQTAKKYFEKIKNKPSHQEKYRAKALQQECK